MTHIEIVGRCCVTIAAAMVHHHEDSRLTDDECYGVVIVNWNGGERLLRCLAALSTSRRAPTTVIIVDNGSVDGSERRALAVHPDHRLIKNSENLGFAAACNQGIRHLVGRGIPFVFLLNDDALVDESTIIRLIEAGRRHPRAGLFAGKILHGDGKSIWCAGVDVGFHANLQRLRGIGRTDDGSFDEEHSVDALTGCGLLIRAEVTKAIGLLDERFFVYVEDVDYCIRARRAGFASVYVPSSVMRHDASSSSGGGYSAWRKYMVAYNVALLLKKHGGVKLWTAFFAIECLLWPALLLVGLVRGRHRAVLAKARGYLAGFLGLPFERPCAKLPAP